MNTEKPNKVNLLNSGYIELLDIMGDDLAIVNAARVSYLGESKGEVKDKKLLFYLMKNFHTTPFEMVSFKFRVKCPLFISKQWMRHRTWSYNEVSRRYTSEAIDFYIPDNDKWRKQSKSNKQASAGFLTIEDHNNITGNAGFSVLDREMSPTTTRLLSNYLEKYNAIGLDLYNSLIDGGVAREMARMVLSPNMYTTFIAKVDAHNLMHFLKLRMSDHAQYEIRVYAEAIYNEFFKPNLQWTAEAFEKYQLNKEGE